MFDKIAAHREIAGRNRLHAEAHLPLVSVEEELRRYKKADAKMEFDDFIASPLRERVSEKFLNAVRRKRNDPDWRPRGMLSGGGLWFELRVTKRMERIWRRQQRLDVG